MAVSIALLCSHSQQPEEGEEDRGRKRGKAKPANNNIWGKTIKTGSKKIVKEIKTKKIFGQTMSPTSLSSIDRGKTNSEWAWALELCLCLTWA